LRLRQAHTADNSGNDPAQPNEPTLALAEACVVCARRSYRVLIDAWINGTFPTFDYTFTQYLFSTCIILAISSLSQAQWPNTESEDFEAAVQILNQLSQNGSYSASDFMRHVSATKALMDAQQSAQGQGDRDQTIPHTVNSTRLGPLRTDGELDNAAGFSFSEPSLQDLLAFDLLDLDTLETPFSNEDFQSFYWSDANADVVRPGIPTNASWNPAAVQPQLNADI
jgi:proline utilization trans-activator